MPDLLKIYRVALSAIFIFGGLAGGPAEASVVRVFSSYVDQNRPDHRLRVAGSGILFKLREGRQFVFTASHVSQGDGTEIEFGDRRLSIVGRARGPNNDLEIFEVTGADPASIDAELDGSHIVYRAMPEGRVRWIDSFNFVPIENWVADPHVGADSLFARNRLSVLRMDFFNIVLHAESLIQPGTSGSALITQVPDLVTWPNPNETPYDVRESMRGFAPGKLVLRGMGIRRERFFSGAGFVPYSAMRALLTQYLEQKTETPEWKWYAQGPLLFRVFQEYTRETASLGSNTAGGVISDSGNGLSMDGGDLATLAEDEPASYLSKVSAFPETAGEPTISWVTAMRHPKTSFFINFMAWFDMEFYPALHLFTWGLSPEKGQSPLQLVKKTHYRFRVKDGRPFEVQSPQYIRFDDSGVFFRLKLPGQDTLEFQLNSDGLLAKADGTYPEFFAPVIEVPSKSGQTYLVDLHRFFFVDFATTQLPRLRTREAEQMSPEDLRNAIYDELQWAGAYPKLSFRKKRSDLTRPMSVEEGLPQTIEWSSRPE